MKVDVYCVDSYKFTDWFVSEMNQHFNNEEIILIPGKHDEKADCSFFCDVEIEEALTIEELLSKSIHDDGQVKFYVAHALAYAYGKGIITEKKAWFYYAW